MCVDHRQRLLGMSWQYNISLLVTLKYELGID